MTVFPIDDLPDVVLAHVLHLAADSEKTAIELSTISKRWRRLARRDFLKLHMLDLKGIINT